MVMALYRAACEADKSYLPFVFSCPNGECELREEDKLFVFGNPVELEKCLAHLNRPLSRARVLVEQGPYFVSTEFS